MMYDIKIEEIKDDKYLDYFLETPATDYNSAELQFLLKEYVKDRGKIKDFSNYTEGLEIKIFNAEELLDPFFRLKNGYMLDQHWKNVALSFGKYFINIEENKKEIVKLIGFSYTFCDYYYIYEKEDGSIIYDTCVSGLKEEII